MDYRTHIQVTGKVNSGQVLLADQLEQWCENQTLEIEIEIVSPSEIDDEARLVITKNGTLYADQLAHQIALENAHLEPYIQDTRWKLSDSQAYRILQTNPLFDSNTSYTTWETRAHQISDFAKRYHRMPKRTSKNESEAVLGAWVNEQRKQYKRGKLTAGEICFLESILQWGWTASQEAKGKTLAAQLRHRKLVKQIPDPLEFRRDRSTLIVGGFGSGKTTVLAALVEGLPRTEPIGMLGSSEITEMLPEHKIIKCSASFGELQETRFEAVVFDGLDFGSSLFNEPYTFLDEVKFEKVPLIGCVDLNTSMNNMWLDKLFDYKIICDEKIVGGPID